MAGLRPERATIYDVARMSGVSIGTVSRVLNNRREVSEATRRRVLDAARRTNFVPQQTTRRVSVALVLQDTEKVHEVGYVSTVVSALVGEASRLGAVIEIVSLREIDVIYGHYVRGLVGLLFGRAAEKLRAVRHVPVVLINNASESGTFRDVGTDHAEGARMGTAYLLRQGHRRIALVQIEREDWGARERERGYREALAGAGVTAREELVVYLEDRPLEERFDPVLRRNPTAVFACGEDLSIAVYDALVHRLGRRLPGDLSLVTYEVPILSQVLLPPQTTIAQPWEEMARAALARVLALVNGEAVAPEHATFPNRLIERASVCRRA